MSILIRDRGVGESKREMTPRLPVEDLASPFGKLGCNLSDSELRETAYEIFVGANRSSGGKPLTYISQSERVVTEKAEKSLSLSPSLSGSPSLQRSLTSTAASKMKKALGLKSSSKRSPVKDSSTSKSKKPVTIGELMRVQMRVSEQTDSRVRRALLRIAAGQLGRTIESIVLPLELLQQFKASDFPDHEEYEAWQARNLKVLEAGLLLHPSLPLEKSNTSVQRLRQIIRGASERPIETGRNSESMQVLRTTVMSLACRQFDGFASEMCHWADGYPLNLRLYQMLLEACFDCNDETSVIEEVDEVIELIKKTWVVLGVNQMLHNLCFSWILFNRYVATGQVEHDLLTAADTQLAEVAKDAKVTKDPVYAKILSSTLNSIMNWVERRLLAYHETFHKGNMGSMESIVSLGVSAARLMVEDISYEYRRKRKEEVDVTRNKIEAYIRSSLRTAFAQRMEKADSTRRSSRNQPNSSPRLYILANDIGELASMEKSVFSPILKKWHSFAAGVAVATLHTCYGSELKQFMDSLTDLTPENVQILKAADKLEKDLVLIAVEDSVDSDDGGKAIIREMPPYEAETKVADLARNWIKTRVDTLKGWIDRNLQQEAWNARAHKENFAPSCVEVLRLIDETLNAFFQLPIPMHQALLPDLVTGLDRGLQHYIFKAKSGCGTRNSYIPTLPALTRCTTGSKFQGVFKKKEKLPNSQKRKSQVGSLNGDDSFGIPQLCVRINTLYHIRTQVDSLEKKMVNCVRDLESSHGDNIANGIGNKFELSLAACQEGIQQLCEAISYKLIFHDLRHVLWDGLYVGDVASTRIEPFRQELDSNLEVLFNHVSERMRTHVVKSVMKASFEGFLLVLLAGGPSRAFSRNDSQIIEDDFAMLKAVYVCGGDGLPEEMVEKAATTVRNVLPLFRTNTESLIERFRSIALEMFGSAAKSKLPLPPTPGQWSPTEPNTILRVLCYRNDEAASKFLKKTYNLPKKL
ncbi:protein unc-13 homolog isoform X1 [Aristolochia californica]|uniref:protein unc-13 homolog isoform X1 n=2 Tax=Aristolochia californica TaxID=171875 RepID=UPI0035DAC9BA